MKCKGFCISMRILEWDMMILKFYSILYHTVIHRIINPAHLDIRRAENRNIDKNETSNS